MGIYVKSIANLFLSKALYEEGCGLDHYITRLVFGEGKEEEEEEEEGGEGAGEGGGGVGFYSCINISPSKFRTSCQITPTPVKVLNRFHIIDTCVFMHKHIRWTK